MPVVGNGDGGRRSWEQDGDSAYRTENQQGSELTGTRSAGYATIVRTTPARGSCGSNTQTTFSSERPRPVTFAQPPSRPTDRDPSATFTMVSEGFSNGMGVTPVCLGGESVQQLPEHMPLPSGRGDLGASMPQLGNVQPWPPPGGAELMGRVNTVPCLGTGERSDQWGGDRGQQNNVRCLPQFAVLADPQAPVTPSPYPPQPQVQGGHLGASLWLPQQRGVVRNTMGSHPAVCTPPVGRVGQEYLILFRQLHLIMLQL